MNKGFQRSSKRTRKTWIKDVYWSQTEHTQQQPWRTPRPQPSYGISFASNWHLFPGGCSFFGRKGKEEERGTGRMLGNHWPKFHLFCKRLKLHLGGRAAATGWIINNRFIKAIQAPDKTPQACSWGSSFRTSCSWLITLSSPMVSPSVSKGCCTPTWRCLS